MRYLKRFVAVIAAIFVIVSCKYVTQNPNAADVDGAAGVADYIPNPITKELGPRAWRYFAHRNFGVREDGEGKGHFIAPRRETEQHTGIDFYLPDGGTTLYAPCDGTYLAGSDSGYGNWAQVICKYPTSSHYISMLFGHMSKHLVSVNGSFATIAKGTRIGISGKTGNASGYGIDPHVHFEAIVHDSLAAAQAEMHRTTEGGVDTPASISFVSHLKSQCLNKYGIQAIKSTFNANDTVAVHYGNRIDPFILFVCTAEALPRYSFVSKSQVALSNFYSLPASLKAVLE